MTCSVGITQYKAENSLEYLERSFLLIRASPAATNVLKEPKVVMQPPYRLLCSPSEPAICPLREDTPRGKTPDYVIDLDGHSTVAGRGGIESRRLASATPQ